MGKKPEAGTPKAISNKMESAGLKKLKFYCQMCKKQCSDKNGFQCHLNSDQHKQKMRGFAEDSSTFLNEFSETFATGFIELMKTKFFGMQYPINKIYMEYIKHKHHVHMNATEWTTLTEFAHHLEKIGLVTVEGTERGCLITLIDKTQKAFERNLEVEKKQQQEEKLQRQYEQLQQKQMDRAREIENQRIQQLEEQENNNKEESKKIDGPISISIGFKQPQNKQLDNEEDDEEEEEFGLNNKSKSLKLGQQSDTKPDFNFQNLKRDIGEAQKAKEMELKRKLNDVNNQNDQSLSGMDLLKKKMKTEKEGGNSKKEEKTDYNDTPWVQEGIVVKIKDKNLKKFYKKKGHIVAIKDQFMAKVQVNEESILIDQSFLETTIPKIGNEVMVLKPGEFQGKKGILEGLQKDNFSGSILLENDVAVSMPYEYMSKIYNKNEE